MKKSFVGYLLIILLVVFSQGIGAPKVKAWRHGGGVCQFGGTASVDGCSGAPVLGMSGVSVNATRNAFFGTWNGSAYAGGSAAASGQTWASLPQWNVAGVDYVVGISASTTLNSPTGAQPAHCSTSAADGNGVAIMTCQNDGGAGITIDSYDFSCTKVTCIGGVVCVWPTFTGTITGPITITNSIFIGKAGCPSIGNSLIDITTTGAGGSSLTFQNNYVDADPASRFPVCGKTTVAEFTATQTNSTTWTVQSIVVPANTTGFPTALFPAGGPIALNNAGAQSRTGAKIVSLVGQTLTVSPGYSFVGTKTFDVAVDVNEASNTACGYGSLARLVGSGETLVERNVFKNSAGSHIWVGSCGGLTVRYNYLEGNQVINSINHGNVIDPVCTGNSPFTRITYNIVYETGASYGGTSAFETAHVNPGGGHVIESTVSNNVAINNKLNSFANATYGSGYPTTSNSRALLWMDHVNDSWNGTVGGWRDVTIANNYIDVQGALYCSTLAGGGTITNQTVSGNVVMTNGVSANVIDTGLNSCATTQVCNNTPSNACTQ